MSGCRNVRVAGVSAVRKAVLPGVFATVSVLGLTLALSPPATAAYGLEGAGAASGRAGTLIRPDGLVWTLADGSCVGQNLPGGIVRTDSRITFTPPQPGVTYQVRKVVKGDHPDGNYHPVGIVATLSGPVVNRPLAPQTADPRLEYLFVQAKVGNWVSNSHVVGCTPTKPGVVKEEPPVVIPIWGLPGYRGARTPDNPNPVTPPPALPTPGRSGV